MFFKFVLYIDEFIRFNVDCRIDWVSTNRKENEITFTEHADGAEWAPHVPPAAAAANALLPGTCQAKTNHNNNELDSKMRLKLEIPKDLIQFILRSMTFICSCKALKVLKHAKILVVNCYQIMTDVGNIYVD